MRLAPCRFTAATIMLAIIPVASAVQAQTSAKQGDPVPSPDTNNSAEIIVTAQKRSERLSDVPISITAVTGDQLARQGITSAADLERVVPGFTYQPSSYGVPVFAIRGVGFYETSLAVAPAVSVYLDQIPLPYLAMTPGVSFDLARVEALKGPQGTLFGQNSTGGAINYIAAKPTRAFEAGLSASYGRFNEFDTEGYISGPLNDTLSARLAVRSERRGDWQKSYTRDDTLGHRDFLTGRLLLDWAPSNRVHFELNVNGWRDKSDTQAAQYIGYSPTIPNGRPEQAAILPTYPLAPNDIRSADWDANTSLRRNNRFYQISLRGDADMADWAKLTSITAYSDYRDDTPTDTDGVNFADILVHRLGHIRSFSQELRMSGESRALKWMIGGNAQADTTDDNQGVYTFGSNQSIGPFTWNDFVNTNHQKISTWAGFGSLEYALTHQLTLQGSLRYTDQDRDFRGCLRDVDGRLAAGFSFLSTILSGSPTVIPTGACITFGPNAKPVPIVNSQLNQDNLSWRGGINWKPNSDTLLYANVTRGYKAGSFGTLPALNASQLTPVTQESLLAYEAGFKLGLFDRHVQLSGAAFYYDYSDKQILGYINTGIPFGNLPGLVTIPRSSVRGGEIELTARPGDQLRVTFGATYVDSKVDRSFLTPDPYGRIVDVKGEQFPNTPKWQFVGDTEYTEALSNSLSAFVGGSVKYRSSSYAAFGENAPFRIGAYALVDLRAGVESSGGCWRAQIWGRNVTNKRYLVHVTHVIDTVSQLTGMPATYGVTLSFKFR